jgi:GNAT superfamily N-acetyltransferase
VAVDSDRRPVWFALASSDRHPDAARVELLTGAAEREIGEDAVCIATYDDLGRVAGLQLGPRGARKAPPLWFAEIRESAAQPPAVNLVAFTGHGTAAGALVDESALAELPVRSEDQLGAVRWYPVSGELDQIYVQPEWRRRTIASGLLAAAATLSYARGWPRMWSDGQRTDEGERLREAGPWRARAARRTHVAPPMTPPQAR